MKSTAHTLILGTRAVIETIISGKSISKILLHHTGEDHLLRKQLLELAQERQIPCQKVPLQALKRLTRGNHQGTVAFISPIPFADLGNQVAHCYEQGKTPLIVLLDQVQDVRNVGAIARTAVSMGVDALVVPMQGAALISGDAMKTSAGALNHLPVCRVKHFKEAIAQLQASGLQVLACDEKATQPISQADLSLPTALLFGGEEKGIAPTHRKMADGTFLIPTQGPIASLNVSVATSIVLYETTRQRRLAS